MKTVVTTCIRDCPGVCSIIAHVEDEKAVKLTGNMEHKFTAGLLCGSTKNTLKIDFTTLKEYYILLKRLMGNGKE